MFGFRRRSAPPAAPLVIDLASLDKTARGEVGLKAANLGELHRAGVRVPAGFAISAEAYRTVVHGRQFDAAVRATDALQLQRQAHVLQQQITAQPLPKSLEMAVRTAYQRLIDQAHRPLVAVRSSIAVPGDTDGRQTAHSATVLNVQGSDAVLVALRHVWAAAVAPTALTDWLRRGIDPAQVQVAVVVQQMVAADRSGVLYTADPASGDRSTLVIEAVRGLGPALTAGLVTPDRYTVDRESLAILERTIAPQSWQLGRAEVDATGLAGTRHVAIPAREQGAPKLTDNEIVELAQIGRQLVEHFGGQLDIEWAIEDGQMFVLEARPVPVVTRQVPVTTEDGGQKTEDGNTPPDVTEIPTSDIRPLTSEPLARGASASLGVATGIARIVHSPADFDRIKRGDVVVTELTTLNLTPILPQAAALVTDTGGRTSHAAISGHEHGIPVVVGTGTGTHTIRDGQMITVDGTAGVVYAGKQEFRDKNSEFRTSRNSDPRIPNPGIAPNSEFRPLNSRDVRPLGTKLYAILSDPAQAAAVAAQPVDGVGLLRAEFMIAGLGEHPAAMEAAGRGEAFTQKLARELGKFAAAFSPRPVIYRTSDFKSNEYRSLNGGESFEPHEENPMLGYRGVARYLAEPRLFRRELAAIKQVRDHHKNVWLMLPFVRTVEELHGALKLIQNAGLEWQPRPSSAVISNAVRDPARISNGISRQEPRNDNQTSLRIYMMCELPSNVILLDEFLDAGIDGVSIGSNDLTQLILGIDRDSERLAAEFDERDPAVSKAIEYVIKTCRKRGVPVGLCGQAASEHPDFAEKLVEWGITSLSVNPDAIESTRSLIASIEAHHHHPLAEHAR